MPIPSLLLASLALPVAAQVPDFHGLPLGSSLDQESASKPSLALAKPRITCHDFRLNSFTESSQDNVSIGAAPDGSLVVVWHSRRQENGTYGVRARRIDEEGKFLSEEIPVNATSEGMQVEPSVSLDPSGAAWFAWVSRGQDGSGDGVYARRFAGKLDAASPEVRVDNVFEGDQSEASIVALTDGRALCTWTGPAQGDEAVIGRRALFARFLAANGRPDGDKFELKVGEELGVRTPTTTGLGDGALVAASTYDDAGRPAGIYLFEVDARGRASAGVRVDGAQSGNLPVEPSLASTQGRAAIAWLEAELGEDSGEYRIRWRNLPARESPKSTKANPSKGSLSSVEPGMIHTVEAPEHGYTSGLAVAVKGSDTALVWSRHLTADNGSPRLFCQVVREDPSDQAGSVIALMEARPATESDEGKQAMAVGGAGQRAQFTASGQIAAVWHGDAELGDSSGAHLTFVSLTDRDGMPRIVADATSTARDPAAANASPTALVRVRHGGF